MISHKRLRTSHLLIRPSKPSWEQAPSTLFLAKFTAQNYELRHGPTRCSDGCAPSEGHSHPPFSRFSCVLRFAMCDRSAFSRCLLVSHSYSANCTKSRRSFLPLSLSQERCCRKVLSSTEVPLLIISVVRTVGSSWRSVRPTR